MHGLSMSKTFQGWLVTSVLTKIYHVRNTSRNKKQKCLPEKEQLKGQQLKKRSHLSSHYLKPALFQLRSLSNNLSAYKMKN